MKQFFLVLAISICTNVFATVRTVSNNAGMLAQFSTIQAAVNASVNGDTIYVHGSSVQYAGFTITDKRLVVIGPGWSPMQAFMPFQASIYESYIIGSGASNTEFHGLHFITTLYVSSLNKPDNLRFIRNHFGSTVTIGTGTNTYSGYVFEGNWFDGAGLSVPPGCFFVNFLFTNNIFYCANSNTSASGFYNSSNVVFDHNLFYGPSSGSSPVFGSNCRGLLLTNNIFVRRNAAANLTFSTFNNNITFNAGVNNPWDPTFSNSGTGNIAGTDPQMTDQIGVNAGTNNPLLNFNIAAGPANNSGTEGKDIGLLYDPSGSLNWTISRMSRLPYVYSMNITNPSVPAGGTLNVQVQAKKNN